MNGNVLTKQWAWPKNLRLLQAGEVQETKIGTLSAPKLLANYDKIKEDNTLRSVFIDCSKLECVSSAGLHVLLIMQNDCEGGITMKSCNETIIEISSDNIKIK